MSARARWLLTIGVLAFVGAGFADLHEQRERKAELLSFLDQSGLSERQARLADLVERDPDVVAAADRVALALVADVLDPASRVGVPEHRRQDLLRAQVDRLDHARDLARGTLGERPTSWQALTALGAATYLSRSFRRDDRLIREYRDWEAPLERARELAPARSEPARFLTMAYLEIWPMLSEAKRELTRSMLARALADPVAYRTIIDPWLQVARNDAEAITLLPEEAWVQGDLARRFTRRGNPGLAAEMQRRFRTSRLEELRKVIEEVRRESARGDFIAARKTVVLALPQVPVDARFEQTAQRLIAVFPSGPLSNARPFAEAWLDYELVRCLRRGCSLAESMLERILPSVEPGSPQELVARLSLGDLETLGDLEAALVEPCGGPFRRYWLAKATVLLRRSEMAAARSALLMCAGHPPPANLRLLHQRIVDSLRPGLLRPEALEVLTSTREPAYQSTGNEIELALPSGDWELLLELGEAVAGEPVLVEVVLDGDVIGVVGHDGATIRHRIALRSSGAVQILRQRVISGRPVPLTVVDAIRR